MGSARGYYVVVVGVGLLKESLGVQLIPYRTHNAHALVGIKCAAAMHVPNKRPPVVIYISGCRRGEGKGEGGPSMWDYRGEEAARGFDNNLLGGPPIDPSPCT